ncbi:hypothetical protein LNAOJCKE_0906 [Methylorubrum aminovorans]|uniref:Nucleotidyl transferase AbiEii/AbiGii toxin family protein n=1 Tax=Methylorubrum aminovorans TaxID=269069 RepID=A0ABQ4U9K7_9HYPH|nr:hypothetical protein [Methylorubrum aminovorans]GJE63708.1 hypothetical protein LNAOJCKE_0906 [Methylorubrum aminovorans]GMA73639.1 hypothetical protein GCM10025880_00560 [Methylorubrum aminovorans]GMA79825.1 hypothetical protein GCM10025880_62420 [Methylorubrum aminovorans]
MKAKTIKAVLAKKIGEWAASIEDEALREKVQKNTIVTGGAIASMLLKEPVNDYDIYFRDHATAKAVAEYYVARFSAKPVKGISCPITVDDTDGRIRIVVKSAGIASEGGADVPYEYFEGRPDEEADAYVGEVMGDAGEIQEAHDAVEDAAQATSDDGKPAYRPIFMSTNAITLSNRIQIVLRFYGEPDKIHENYDFVHCTNYWTSWNGELTLRQAALEALLARELRYVGSKYPVCSIIRLRKFIKRGWSINAGQMLKMMMQISALDLTSHAVLQDQLTGVDAAYFVQLVGKLKENDPEKVNAAYLVEIIDRMF